MRCRLLYGAEKSDSQAVRWYLKSALQGHRVAAYDIGVAYLHGSGSGEDDVKRYMWFRLVERFGWEPSKSAPEELDKKRPQAILFRPWAMRLRT